MRRPVNPRAARASAVVAVLALLAAVGAASPALAATSVTTAPPIAGVGDLLSGIANTVLGGVDWTVDVAGDFILNLFGGLVRDLIPRSWIKEGLSIMNWMVAVPDYTAQIGTPGGGHAYGFAGVNAMRGVFTWLGMAIAPLSLVYATSRAWSGQGDHPAVPLVRVFTVAIGVLSYTWLWGQFVALTNQITQAILGVPQVTTGIQKMFELLVAGGALRGLPLIGLILMAVGGIGLLALIFLKVMLVLVGALVYAIGPLMLGVAATERGHALTRAWMSLAVGLFALSIVWASVFAVSAVLINDASGGGAVLGGDSGLGHLFGGVVVAMAAIAGFYLNIKLTKAMAGLVGGQLAGMLALASNRGGARSLLGASRGGGGAAGGGQAAAAGASLRGFASKVGGGAAGAVGAVAPAGRAGAALAGAGTLARGGLIGASGALASRGLAGAANSRVARAANSTRAGAVATKAARGARHGWTAAANPATPTGGRGAAPAARTGASPQPSGRAPRAGAPHGAPTSGTPAPPRSGSSGSPSGSGVSPSASSRPAGVKPTRSFRSRLGGRKS